MEVLLKPELSKSTIRKQFLLLLILVYFCGIFLQRVIPKIFAIFLCNKGKSVMSKFSFTEAVY